MAGGVYECFGDGVEEGDGIGDIGQGSDLIGEGDELGVDGFGDELGGSAGAEGFGDDELNVLVFGFVDESGDMGWGGFDAGEGFDIIDDLEMKGLGEVFEGFVVGDDAGAAERGELFIPRLDVMFQVGLVVVGVGDIGIGVGGVELAELFCEVEGDEGVVGGVEPEVGVAGGVDIPLGAVDVGVGDFE